MFDTLIESRPRQSRPTSATAGSLLAHSVVVVAIIAGTWRAVPAVEHGRVNTDTVIFFTPQPVTSRPVPVTLRIDLPWTTAPLPDLRGTPIRVDLPDVVTDWVRLPGGGGPKPRDERQPGAEPIAAEVADEPPELLTAGLPRYPELLRVAGISGRVVVEAVIDTLGRPERASLKVVSSAHAGFHDAALAYVGGALFRPGRVLGRAVRVRVRVPIEFRLTR